MLFRSTRGVAELLCFQLGWWLNDGTGFIYQHAPSIFENAARSRLPSQVGQTVEQMRQQREARRLLMIEARAFVRDRVFAELAAWALGADPIPPRLLRRATNLEELRREMAERRLTIPTEGVVDLDAYLRELKGKSDG